MLEEINAAANFIVNIVARQPRHDELTQDRIQTFAAALVSNMHERFAPSWRPDAPLHGSANRCIRIDYGRIDSVIMDAAEKAEISKFISKILPSDLTIWVDPQDVSYRMNDRSPLFTIFSPKLAPSEAPTSPRLVPASPPFSPLMAVHERATVGAM